MLGRRGTDVTEVQEAHNVDAKKSTWTWPLEGLLEEPDGTAGRFFKPRGA